MTTAHKYSENNREPSYEKVVSILNRLNNLSLKMGKSQTFTPPQEEVDGCARELIDTLSKYHDTLGKLEVYLKNALIDLTEIPYMQPQMQKIAFEVAVKAAMRNLQTFLDQSNMM